MERTEIEDIFRNSNDNDELFDAFQFALKSNINEIELYKILLANPALSEDEICMYTDKIAKEFKQHSYSVFMWTAKLFEPLTYKIESLEKSFYYFRKAAQNNPTNYIPYIEAMNLFNYEIEMELNARIIKFVEDSVRHVDRKSKVYLKLAEHYKLVENFELQKKYELLAQKSKERE